MNIISMKRKYFYFLFLLTGIFSALITLSLNNNANISSTYATSDKKYKDGYNEKNYDQRYDDDYKQTEYEKLKDNDRNIFYNQNFGYNDYSDDIYSDYNPSYNKDPRMIKAMIQTHMTAIPTTALAYNEIQE